MNANGRKWAVESRLASIRMSKILSGAPKPALTREKRTHIGPPAISCEITYRAGRNYWSSATT